MDRPELPFEYCALRFLLQWEQRERALHEQIAGNPTLQQICSALQYFQVARTFAGLGTDAAAQAVVDALQQVDAISGLSPEAKVRELASRFRKRFNQFNVSAASKLFWLKHKRPYIVYDSRAVNALRDLGYVFESANYVHLLAKGVRPARERNREGRLSVARSQSISPTMVSIGRRALSTCLTTLVFGARL